MYKYYIVRILRIRPSFSKQKMLIKLREMRLIYYILADNSALANDEQIQETAC